MSQGALGAAFAQSAARREKIAAATIIGCLSGMAPDADVVIQSSNDPLLFLEFHRHFTHSLAFVPFGALICAAVSYPLARRYLGFPMCYLFALLGYATHGLLDACTTYGTMLLWPFSDARVAWDNVSVVDPAFTLPIIVLNVMAYRRRRAWLGRVALVWAVAYLGFGLFQEHRALDVGAQLAASRGHVPSAARAMPTIGNLVLWRHVYEHDGRIYVDAVRVGRGTQVFEGASLQKLGPETLSWLDPKSTQANDVARFARFADGYVGVAAQSPTRLVDLRYSALPNEVTGIWAIELDRDASKQAHVRFETSRTASSGGFTSLRAMLFP